MVQTVKGQGGGSLFIKTPSEVREHLRRYSAQSGGRDRRSSIAVFKIADLTQDKPNTKVLPIGEWSGITEGQRRVVQREYNKDGDEVWFSVWNAKDAGIGDRRRR